MWLAAQCDDQVIMQVLSSTVDEALSATVILVHCNKMQH